MNKSGHGASSMILPARAEAMCETQVLPVFLVMNVSLRPAIVHREAAIFHDLDDSRPAFGPYLLAFTNFGNPNHIGVAAQEQMRVRWVHVAADVFLEHTCGKIILHIYLVVDPPRAW